MVVIKYTMPKKKKHIIMAYRVGPGVEEEEENLPVKYKKSSTAPLMIFHISKIPTTMFNMYEVKSFF